MSEVLTLTLPMPPNLANRPMHHMVKHRVKVGYWALADLMHGFGYDQAALKGLDGMRIPSLARQVQQSRAFVAAYVRDNAARLVTGPKFKPACWPVVTIRSTMIVGARMDTGNAMNRHKWIEDWLVARRFIAGDTPEQLQWEGFPVQIVKRDRNYRIEITLTDISESVRHSA